jgi:hypothetical protein
MTRFKKGPIERFTWGKFVVRGEEHSENGRVVGAGKDIRIVGDKVTPWEEREGHKLTRKMITGIYDEGVDVLVIGVGAEKRLECPKRVRKDIRKHGIKRVVLAATPKACKKYNELVNSGKRVALLAHGTC